MNLENCNQLSECLKAIVPALVHALVVFGCIVGVLGILFMHYFKGLPLEGTYFKELLGIVLIESGFAKDETA